MTTATRIVFSRSDGTPVDQETHAERTSSLHRNQAEVDTAAREMLGNPVGVNWPIGGGDGKVSSEDIVSLAATLIPPATRGASRF